MTDLRRGVDLALTGAVPQVDRLAIGVQFGPGERADLLADTVVLTLLCDRDARVISPEHAVFFNQPTDPDACVEAGQPPSGSGTEQVRIVLSAVPALVQRIVVAAYLNRTIGARRNLGELTECVVAAVNAADGTELARSENLAGDLAGVAAATLAEVHRDEDGWKLKILGAGHSAGIAALAADHGLVL